MINSYYHITSPDEWLKIKKEGLRSSKDGYVYLLTRKDIASYVAKNQLFIFDDYRLIEVNPKGITGIIENDNVGEITAKYQTWPKSLVYQIVWCVICCRNGLKTAG